MTARKRGVSAPRTAAVSQRRATVKKEAAPAATPKGENGVTMTPARTSPGSGDKKGIGSRNREEKRRLQAAEKARALISIPDDMRSQCEPMWVPVNEIFVDTTYQRDPTSVPGMRRVRAIADDFDPDAFGLIYLSMRGPNLYACMDGGHRVEVYRYFGWTEDLIMAAVYKDLTVAEEAKIYHRMNAKRTQPTPLNLFNSLVEAHDPHAMALARALEDGGIILAKDGSNPAPGVFRAISQAQRIYKSAGPDILRQSARLVTTSWADKKYDEAHSGALLAGVAYLIWLNRTVIDVARLGEKLHNITPGYILGRAKQFKDTTRVQQVVAVATVLAQEYNHQLRTRRLPEVSRSGWPRGGDMPEIDQEGVTTPYVAILGTPATQEEVERLNGA